MRIFTTALLILIALCSTASIGQTQSTTAPIFNPPLGYRDNYVYGAPYYADYGIKNPFPGNYTLELRSPSIQLLKSSAQPSNNDESIHHYTTSSGTYRARIYSAGGFSHTDSYRLKVDVVQAPTQ